ncbi:MAG: UbiA family prenyltransferase [Planctomycetaceae bacterium]
MLAWARLVRLPNLATAAADSLAGFLVVSRLTALDWPPAACGLAVLASLAFYAAGMVLNDVCDVELDRVERPERPLPSGAIAVRLAALVGSLLMAGGAAAACGAAVAAGSPWPALVGAALTLAIWLYDRHAKATLAGPAVMGLCRGLNWLLGMTAAGGPTQPWHWAIPAGMSLYVAGITLFARDEAAESRRAGLVAGCMTMAFGLAVAAGFVWGPLAGGVSRVATLPASTWLICWGLLAASILARAGRAVADPSPMLVRSAVGNAIMAIITLDAVLVLAAYGERWAIVVIGLLAWFVVGRRLVPPT